MKRVKSKRITLFLGELQPLVDEAAEREGISVYQWVRNAIAKKLKVKSPIIAAGRPKKQSVK